jgi:uncharacterized cupredoxin-like copper-binding protein
MALGGLLLGAVALVACGGGGGGAAAAKPGGAAASGPAQEITVRGQDTMRFEPSQLTARAGQPIRVTLDDSNAALVHDFTIDNAGGQRVEIKAQPRAKANAQFTVPAGTYQFYCAEPGHREAGMVGTLTVS